MNNEKPPQGDKEVIKDTNVIQFPKPTPIPITDTPPAPEGFDKFGREIHVNTGEIGPGDIVKFTDKGATNYRQDPEETFYVLKIDKHGIALVSRLNNEVLPMPIPDGHGLLQVVIKAR